MKVFLTIASIVFLTMALSLNVSAEGHENALKVFEEVDLPNTVTTVYLRNRMYDTIFEVLVFSTVVFGIKEFHRGKERGADRLGDRVFRGVSGFIAFILMSASLYLALTGHLYPGGGFTAGVAGGTALLIVGMRDGVEKFERDLERFRMESLEKALVVAVVLLALAEFKGFRPDLAVPMQSFLIYSKVMGGTWLITYTFMKHRGIV